MLDDGLVAVLLSRRSRDDMDFHSRLEFPLQDVIPLVQYSSSFFSKRECMECT